MSTVTVPAPKAVQPVADAGHPRRWLILFVILAAECMDLLDSTVVNVAAPSIRADLGASTAGLQWIVGGYALAFAIGLVTGGRLGDVFGRRRLFLLGVGGFTAASALCGLAPSEGALVGARLLQGAFAAVLIPQGFGIVKQVFSAQELPKAFATFGPVMGLAAVAGPIVGGALTDGDLLGTGWRMIFLLNLPVGVLTLVAAVKLLPESRLPVAPRLDLTGMALVSLAAGLLMYPLIQGRELGWPAWTFVAMGASALLLGAFALHVRRLDRAGADPLVLPSLFARRAFSGGLAFGLVFFGGMMGVLLALTLFLQLGAGFSAIHTGLAYVPFSLGTAVGAGLAGGLLAPRFGRRVLQAGMLLAAAGTGWLLVAVDGPVAEVTSLGLAPALAVVGLGFGLAIAPFFDTVLAAVRDEEVGAASGTLNAVQQFGTAAGIAVLGTVFFSAVPGAGFAGAFEHVLWIEGALLAVAFALVFLLPRRAREGMAAHA